jgi:OOP family OmpA-OmpF porin
MPVPAGAFEPVLPVGARLTAERASQLDSFDAPIGVFDGDGVPTLTVEGAILRRAWRLDAPGLTPLQVMVPLRRQLGAEGYRVIFECASQSCGGFDFRFATEVLPGPNMYVDLTRFRYLTATRGGGDDPEEVVGILVSVTAASAYLQIIAADRNPRPAPVLALPARPPETAKPVPPPSGETLEARLFAKGHVVLADLDFGTGTSDLGPGPFRSLAELSDLLKRRTRLRLALVGHTDSVGDLDTNIALSRARARAVRARLIEVYGVDPARLEAEGMGYLAPVASNLSEEGRAENRRVEVILVSDG